MKIAFIAHPIADYTYHDGKIVTQSDNVEKILLIIRELNLDSDDVVPFAPYIPDCICLDDSSSEQRQRGQANTAELFYRKFIDEVRVYGDRISSGVKEEIDLATKLFIPVFFMTEETAKQALDMFPDYMIKLMNKIQKDYGSRR